MGGVAVGGPLPRRYRCLHAGRSARADRRGSSATTASTAHRTAPPTHSRLRAAGGSNWRAMRNATASREADQRAAGRGGATVAGAKASVDELEKDYRTRPSERTTDQPPDPGLKPPASGRETHNQSSVCLEGSPAPVGQDHGPAEPPANRVGFPGPASAPREF